MIKKVYLPTIFLLIGVIQTGWTQYALTNEIISNDIYLLDGSSDTLWMLTSKGVNYTTSIVDSPMAWNGFKNVIGFNISFVNGNALVCLSANNEPNDLWLFNHKTAQYSTIPLSYEKLKFDTIQKQDDPFILLAIDAIWFDSAFWIACVDGGLVKLDLPGNISAIFYPGKDSIAYNFATFNPNSLSIKSPDHLKRIIAVAADSSLLWVACEKALWSFNPKDTTWAKINDSVLFLYEYIDIEVHLSADTSFIYTTFVKSDTTYHIYSYNSVTSEWNESIESSFKTPPSIALGAHDYIYVVSKEEDKNYITLYEQTSSNTVAEKLDNFNFPARMINAVEEGIGNFTIKDINYSISGNDTLFQIATDLGLFFSNNEHYDEVNKIPFKFERRKVPLSSGLKKTYAVPGIINEYHKGTVFAYNLSKDDHVTIDIFDYNMDHVIRIIDNAPRQAGEHTTGGRSTIPVYDHWDGTVNNRNGRPVAPGVYYYRIKTKSGKRTFGKVIVARN